MTSQQANQVAKTILNQLGGRRFMVMTGAKNFVSLNEQRGGIMFSIPTAQKKINKVEITLTSSDLYEVKFYHLNLRNFDDMCKLVAKYEDVFCEDLVSIFESETGLYTKL